MDELRLPTYPRRLNLGCGFDHRAGYLNVDFQDFHNPDLKADVRDLAVLPSDEFDEALAYDVLEHLERAEVVPTLREWRRVLSPGGSLQIRTTDIVGLGAMLSATDTVAHHGRMIHNLYGTQAYTGDYHLSGFTDLTLIDHLFEAGFDRIRIARHHGWLLVADARRREEQGPAEPIAIGLDSGAHEVESDGNLSWRWCEQIVHVLLFARTEETVRGVLRLALTRPDSEVGVEVLGDGVNHRSTVRDNTTVDCEVTLAPGPNRISVVSQGTPCNSPGDPRNLYVRLHEIDVAFG